MSTTDIRAWAKSRGMNIGDHGRIPGHIQAAYDAEHEPVLDDLDDYDGGVGPDDFTVIADEPEAAGPVAAAPVAAVPDITRRDETRPRVIGPPRRPLRDRLRRGPRPAAAKGARPKVPRVSLARLIEDVWAQLAFAASPLPPMQRLLQSEGPLAGLVLDDAIRGTAADKILQPAARAEEKVKAVGGVVMPPAALMAVLMTAPQPVMRGDQVIYPELSLQHKAALISLRWSLMLMAEAGSIRLDEYRERAEENAARGRQADQYMAWILGIEEPPADVEQAVTAEEDAIRRAQAMFGDEQ